MTVGQLEQRLKKYPRDTTVLIMASTDDPHYPKTGVTIQEQLVATFVRPDIESVPASVFLVPVRELKAE